MILYALVSEEIERVIEFFFERAEAETMLGKVLRDEPDWGDILRVEEIELNAG